MKETKEVVIVGAGFGGLQAVKKLAKRKDLNITLIDRANHHLFQPLLYQVATAVLSPADIAIPSRSLTENCKNVTVIMSNVTAIDKEKRIIFFNDRALKYDYLILAMGAKTSYFGNKEWEKYTIGLKSLTDALKLRKKILFSFEDAENYPENAGKLLKYIIIGGGPTGVELAGSIAELSHNIIRKDFRKIDTSKAEVILIEGGARLLPAFDAGLSEYAKQSLEKRGVKVYLNTKVKNIEEGRVFTESRMFEANTIIWAAGVEPVPFSRELGFQTDRAGRVIVNKFCSVDSNPEIFIIGDMAAFTDDDGKLLPGVSPVAMQQGRYAARTIVNDIKKKERTPFRYIDKGSMATIGRKDAVAELGKVKYKGLFGWLSWLGLHIFYLVGFKNKISILLTWMWSYLTFGAGARVIQSPIDVKDTEVY
ncbi:MAG: NAD(P)/FAD-dependent oxidoreductase [Ignavibacteria bacterium]|nr:NAD(P)/FAD-dependent oxidoreductase [Ignavibacteria bacterium]